MGAVSCQGAQLLHPQPGALVLVLPCGPQGSLPCCHSQQHTAAQALFFPCSFPAFLPTLPERTEQGGQPHQPRAAALPSAPAMPCARAVGTCVPPARAVLVTGQSFPAVVVEGCVLVECVRNGARPHLRHAHPMATAEPAQRHDGGWHLCIFSFCCIALRAGNEGCGHPATRIQQPMLCTPLVGIAAARGGGSTVC